MTEIECLARKWGGSVGIVIPKDVAEAEGIALNDKVMVSVRRDPLAKVLWKLKPLKRTEPTQKVKDELRLSW